MAISQYIVDAFTDTIFKGNPAAVCISEKPLSEHTMQQIAIENNLSETAFIIPRQNGYGLRWFTPGGEIDLCGHATLAASYIIMRFVEPERKSVDFFTKSGQLSVAKKQDLYEMDMPVYHLTQIPVTEEMTAAIGFRPLEAWKGRDLVCVLENENQVINATPKEEKIKELDGLLLQLTAAGEKYDCVTRSFAPKLGVTEDPVCGSGHCHVIPLWTEKLHKDNLCAYQASKRGGILYCRVAGERIFIAGKAALFSAGELFIKESRKENE